MPEYIYRNANISHTSNSIPKQNPNPFKIKIIEVTDTPQQCNGSDCGIYVLLFMQRVSEYLIKGTSVNAQTTKCAKCISSTKCECEKSTKCESASMSVEGVIEKITQEDRQATQESAVTLRKHFVSMLTARI